MSRAEEVDAQLEALYAQVPAIGCKGLCTDACGPIDGGPRELVRMARAGVKLPPRGEAVRQMYTQGHYRCPALVDGQCSTYEARPFICRAWGASEDLHRQVAQTSGMDPLFDMGDRRRPGGG